MFFVRLFAKVGHQVVPAVCATVISAVVLSALHLTSGPSASPRANGDDTVYIDVLPRINREPQAPIIARVQPAPEEPAAPVAVPPREEVATPPAGRERARAPVTPRSEPALAAKTDPAPKSEPAAALAPPLAIVNAEVQAQPPADEPHRVFGVAVPTPVTRVGGAVVEVVKVPVKVADTVVARPAVWVGEKIVQGVGGIAGWIIPGR